MRVPPPQWGTESVTSLRTSSLLQTRLDEFVGRVQAETRVPGIGLAVSVAGTRFYACAGTRAVGESLPLTSETRFHLGCAGKLLLAMTALELENRGAVATTAAIGEYLPELRGSLHGDAVRVSHLLSHTSGYRGTNILDPEMRSLTWQGLVGYLRSAPRLFAPGSVFSYEHTESVLLGEILRRSTGKPYDQLIDETILQPLGITSAAHGPSAQRANEAGRHRFDERVNRFVALDAVAVQPFWHAAFAERTASLGDLLSIGEAAIGERRGTAGGRIASAATRRNLQRTVVRLPATVGGPLRELLPVAFGLGTAELREGFRGNTGVSAGQCLGIRFDEQLRVCVAVGLNAMVPYLRDFVLAAVCRDLAERPVADEPDEPFGFELADLAGAYFGPGGSTVEVRYDDGRLVCFIGRELARDRLCVELALDDEGRAVLRSPLPHLSLGFFRELGGDVGLMLGLAAYKRGSTERPFHR